ncbi:hypothetical protein ACJIZ3_017716 [Penstemon smallii]|uniref:RIN4 pathogenic type III effector avirulence factor Avr cleavage site domain-containing protein n=1 Tax=Penstemon smallii TaxID=265156 RepID=A0ABD3SWC5_9LAMI
MSRANVPKFGNWENDDNVPYTVYFDKARKTKGGKMINPNDPQENPDMFPEKDPSPFAPPPAFPAKPRTRPEEPIGRGSVRPTPQHRMSQDEGDFKQFNNSPARNEPVYGGGRGQRGARSTRPSIGSEQGFERSPLHPQYQAKVTGGRGSNSPAWDGRSRDSDHATGGRSRLKASTRGDESPEKGAAVPRFGAWDENNPESAENFTHIFNKVREERNTVPGNVTGTPKHPSYGQHSQQPNKPQKCCVIL